MYLVKSCESQYNIKLGSETVRLGTFGYYREFDPARSIADVNEGYLEVKTDSIEPIDFTIDEWNAAFGSVMHFDPDGGVKMLPEGRELPGSVHFDAGGGTYTFMESGIIRMEASASLKYLHPNSFLFCMTMVEDLDDWGPTAIDPTYDSFYAVHESDIHEFGEGLALALSTEMGLERIGYRIDVVADAVSYVPQTEIVISRPSQAIDRDGLFLSAMTTKHESYCHENEFRFVFQVRDTQEKWQAIRPDHVDVPSAFVVEWVE